MAKMFAVFNVVKLFVFENLSFYILQRYKFLFQRLAEFQTTKMQVLRTRIAKFYLKSFMPCS